MSAPAEVAYVAACALGLAFSGHDRADAVELVRAAAGRRLEVLRAARSALPASAVAEDEILDAAADLIGEAMTTTWPAS